VGTNLISSVVGVLVAVIGVAIIAVLVSKKSATADVLNTGGKAFNSLVSQAVSPISGGASLGGIQI